MQTMKTTVSTTALSILVALGITACSSTPKDETNTTGSTQNTPINPQAGQNTQSDANAKAKSEANAKADAEAKSKQKRLEAERKAKAEAEAKAKAEKEQAEKEAKAKAEEQKRLEAEAAQKAEEANKAAEADKQRLQEEAAKKAEEARKAREEEKRLDEIRKHKEDEQNKLNAEKLRIEREIALVDKTKLNSHGKEWRLFDYYSQYNAEFANGLGPMKLVKKDNYGKAPDPYSDEDTALTLSPVKTVDSNVINEISMNDVKKGDSFMGVHQGTYTNDKIEGSKVTKLGGVVEKRNFLSNDDFREIAEMKPTKSVEYIIVNQPYSSYGVLFTSELDPVFFTAVNRDFSNLYHYKNVAGATTKEMVYNDNVKGEAVYKGKVIATVAETVPNTYITEVSKPKLDGDVVLTANFADRESKNTISGYIDSNTVGRITLKPINIDLQRNKFSDDPITYGRPDGFGTTNGDSAYIEKDGHIIAKGDYHGQFVGKDVSGLVGDVTLKTKDFNVSPNKPHVEKKITAYNAIYGAEKQSK